MNAVRCVRAEHVEACLRSSEARSGRVRRRKTYHHYVKTQEKPVTDYVLGLKKVMTRRRREARRLETTGRARATGAVAGEILEVLRANPDWGEVKRIKLARELDLPFAAVAAAVDALAARGLVFKRETRNTNGTTAVHVKLARG